MMRSRAGLNANSARGEIGKESRNLSALKLSSHDDPAVGVDAVNLEHTFGEIKTNCGNLHMGGSSSVASSNDDHPRHSMAFHRAVHPINFSRANFSQ